MTTSGQMFGQPRPTTPGVDEVHVLWTSEGMSCDGDSVSVTAAVDTACS